MATHGDATKKKGTPAQHAFASQTAGAISTLCFYPLDVVKMRFMAQDGTAVRAHNGSASYHHVVPALRTIGKEEGAAGLLRGAHMAVGAATVSWGMYMYTYRQLDAALKAHWDELLGAVPASAVPHRHAGDAALSGSLSSSAVAGIAAGMTVNVMTNPFWLIKARMQLRRQDEPARSVVGTIRDAVARDGVRSLWRGTPMQILAGVPNSLQYPVYEASRRAYNAAAHAVVVAVDPSSPMTQDLVTSTQHGGSEGAAAAARRQAPGWGEVAACTLSTKMVLGAVSHPMQLVKARLMDWRSHDGAVRYESTLQAARLVFQREGVRGFYRGVTVGFMHTVPRTVMQFQLYETALSFATSTSRG